MRRSSIVYTIAAVLSAVSTVLVFAADPVIPARGPLPFDAVDTDGNGFVSQQEFQAAHGKRMQQRAAEQHQYQYRNMDEAPKYADIDTDGDGRVNREEFQAHQQQRMQTRTQEREERHQQRVEYPGGGMGGGKH